MTFPWDELPPHDRALCIVDLAVYGNAYVRWTGARWEHVPVGEVQVGDVCEERPSPGAGSSR